jgi:exopolysaccharide biosynthesis polyprenyl glycosylphosphotransferase
MRITSFRIASSNWLKWSQDARARATAWVRAYQISLVAIDLLLTFLAFHVSYFVRFNAGLPIFKDSIIPYVPFYTGVMLLAVPVWVAIFALMGLYHRPNLLSGTREYSLAFNATTLGMFVVISAGFLFPDELILARGWVILAWLFTFVFIILGRFGCRRFIYALRKKGQFLEPAVIIGGNDEGRLLAEQFAHNPQAGLRIVGYIDSQKRPELEGRLRWLGAQDDLDAVLAEHRVRELILSKSALTQEEVLAVFRQYGTLKDVNLNMTSGLYELITTGMQVREHGTVPVVTINKVRMAGAEQAAKLLLDYCITIPVLILLAPVFALVAVAIRLDSPGPVFYRRRVMGVNGRQFEAFKFRTMRVDSDGLINGNPDLLKEYQANFKIKNDPRVTRVGATLRKWSLDELPQLFNVLRNQMSLVGPRMICPDELDKYDRWDINLMTVKPGLTGLWQVRGRSDVSYEERVRLDMYYVRNWTIWLDLQLLFQTIPAVFSRRGAY